MRMLAACSKSSSMQSHYSYNSYAKVPCRVMDRHATVISTTFLMASIFI